MGAGGSSPPTLGTPLEAKGKKEEEGERRKERGERRKKKREEEEGVPLGARAGAMVFVCSVACDPQGCMHSVTKNI